MAPAPISARISRDPEGLARRFPAAFQWGAATAAYQVEGGWDADGKGESIWDVFCRRPGAIEGGDNGAVSCDHYRLWREDVELMAGLGLNAYRFSVSWPRVMPSGTGPVNQTGLDFYDRLVDALLERNIRPLVTLYHWDLPQALQERGGWLAPDAPAWLAAYAGVVGRRLGDRVADWITVNEPEVVAFAGHATGVHAPGLRDWSLALRVAHSLLLAHGEAAVALRAAAPGSRVGIALNLSPCHPAGTGEPDAAAAARQDGYLNRWFLDPLFGRGYPPDMLELYRGLLPASAVEEVDGWTGGLDFLGINYYRRRIVRAGAARPLGTEVVTPTGAAVTAMGWEIYPDGLHELLLRLHRDYRPPTIVVTENGAAFDDVVAGSVVADTRRVEYLASHLGSAAAAIADGVPLNGYFVWSLMDNFEWSFGYGRRFGLYHTDYASQRRIQKASGRWYGALIRAHSSGDAHS